MQTFEQWLKVNRGIGMPKGDVPERWFTDHDINMVVRCSCCEMTLTAPHAYIDNEGYTYCSKCKGDD